MRHSYLTIGLIAAAMALPASACSRQYEEAGDIAPSNAVSLHISNENFLDMDVYTVTDGVPTRVGTVTGSGSRDFMVRGAVASRSFRVIATPIGGPGRASTGELTVTPGQTIVFRIGPVLANSSVIIR